MHFQINMPQGDARLYAFAASSSRNGRIITAAQDDVDPARGHVQQRTDGNCHVTPTTAAYFTAADLWTVPANDGAAHLGAFGTVEFTAMLDPLDALRVDWSPPRSLQLPAVPGVYVNGVLLDPNGGPLRLIANDGLGIDGPLYYRVKFGTDLRAGGRRLLRDPITFLAPTTSDATVELFDVMSVAGVKAVGLTRGPRGYTPWFTPVPATSPQLYQAVDPEGPVGEPTHLEVIETNNRVNVRSYGAFGDGHTDDSAAIKAAQSDMADGACLYFPPGEYRIAQVPTDGGAVVLSGLNNVSVVFDPGAILLMDNLVDGLSTTSGIVVRGKCEYVTLVDPTVRWKVRPSARGGHSNGIVAFGYPSDTAPPSGWLGSTGCVSHLTVLNPTVHASGEAGMYFIGCSDVNVTGSRAIDTLADGLHFNACRRITVDNHHALNVEDDGLAFVNYYHPTLKWEEPHIGPFWLSSLSEWCSSGTASNIVVNGNRANGFRVQMGRDIAISNVLVSDKDQAFKFTSARLDSGNPWQSLASQNVVVSDVVAVDCAGGGCVETYNIDGTNDRMWWDFKGCQLNNVALRNMGNWSFSSEGKDSDQSAISGFTIKNLKAEAGDSTPGETYGGHGGIRLVGFIDSVIDGVELISDHATAQIVIAGASQLRTDHLWTDPDTQEVVTVHPGVTPEALPPSNLVLDNIVARGCGMVLFQDIAGLTVGRVDTYDAHGVGIVLFKVANARVSHLGSVNPGRTLGLGRGAQVDKCFNVDIAEIVVDTDTHVGADLWQALEVGGGGADYPAGKGVRIEKVVYTSDRDDTVSDIAIQSGPYAPSGFRVQAYWRHSGAISPTWQSQLFGESNPHYLDEYRSHPLYVNTNAAEVGAGTGEVPPWASVVGEIDFNTLTTQGRYYITGPNPGYLFDGTTDKHQPAAVGNMILEVTTKHRSDVGDVIVQTYTPMNAAAPPGWRSKEGTAAAWSSWRPYFAIAEGSLYRELLNSNVHQTMEGRRVGSVASAAKPSFNFGDGWDVVDAGGWAHNVTDFSANAVTTGMQYGSKLRIIVQDNGTARSWVWGPKFIPGPATPIATTVAGRRHYVDFMWDGAMGAFVCVASHAAGFTW